MSGRRDLLVASIVVALVAGCGEQHPPTAEGRYMAYCARCHEVDGTSATATELAGEAVSIVDPEFQSLATDADIARIITRGKGQMMAVTGPTPAEVDSIVLHVRRLGARAGSTLDSPAPGE